MNSIKVRLPIIGLTCAGCASKVGKTLDNHKGIISASVNFASSSVELDYMPNIISLKDIEHLVKNLGYKLSTEEQSLQEREEKQKCAYILQRNNALWSICFALPVFIIGMFYMNMPYAEIITSILTSVVLFVFGRSFFINALNQIKSLNLGMDTLVAISSGSSYLFSMANTIFPDYMIRKGFHHHLYFEAAAVVVSFILLGRFLEAGARERTSSVIKKLIGISPKMANIIDKNGVEQKISIENINLGDVFIIRPGERIPVDGVLIKGNSFVDESIITGESLPAEKLPGSKVMAGTINQKGSFRLRAETTGSNTVLAQMIRLVEQAQNSKAPVQKFVDKISSFFVPSVIGIAILSFFCWIIFGGNNAFNNGLTAFITVLIIACPCALGLATPTAVIAGIGLSAESGILIKDAESLEQACNLNTIVMDKTGTITEANIEVKSMEIYFDKDNMDLYNSVLFALESKSEHPSAKAIVQKLKNEKPESVDIENFVSIPGRGVCGYFLKVPYFVGNLSFMKEKNIDISAEVMDMASALENEGGSSVYYSMENKLLALISVADKIKSGSALAVKKLKDKGLEIYMLSGDNEKTVRAVAKEAGITFYKGNMLPSEKADFIKKIQSEGKRVAMAGDGVNDSEALAVADVGIAMGKGSDIAIEAASITIVSSDLLKIPRAIEISCRTVKTIKQNLFWAFIYNIAAIPVASGITYLLWDFRISPMVAGVLMALSSVSVVFNSLILKTSKVKD